MSTYSEAYKKITELHQQGGTGNTKNLFDFLDKAIFQDSNEIKAFNTTDLPCAPMATCLGTIDGIIKCGTGISTSIPVVSTGICKVTTGVTKHQAIATKNPTAVFNDQSATINWTKGCIELTPELQSITLDFNSMIDECNDCGDFAKGLSKMSAEAIFLGTEQDLMSTLSANAGTPITASGDLLDKLRELYKSVANVQTNKNKKVVIYANQSIINEIKWLRDDNKVPLFDYKGVCPITGCETYCQYNLEIVGVDDVIIPIVGGLTNAYAVCVENVKRTASKVIQKSKTWDECCLESLNNRIVTMNYVSSKIDPILFPNSVKVISLAI